MKDYTFYYNPIFLEAEKVIRWLKSDLSPHQLDLHRAMVGGFMLMRGAFQLHQQAIKDRDWDATEFTLEQLQTHVFTVFSAAVERMNKAAKVAPKKKGGRASAQARNTRDPKQVRAEYDRLMRRYDNDRARAVRQLAKNLSLKPNSVNQLLRKLGLGARVNALQKIRD